MFDLSVLEAQPGITTDQSQGFLDEVWKLWTRDVARAVLLARWYWERIPASIVQQAAMDQRQARDAQSGIEIDRLVGTQLGGLGIFPPNTGGTFHGAGSMDFGAAIFVQVMAMIRSHQGDPPMGTTPLGLAFAEAVLRGERDPVDVLREAASPVQKQELTLVVQLARMSGAYGFIQVEATVIAAFALPRQRIPVFLPGVKDETRCTNCGITLARDARFCGRCGTPIVAPASLPSTAPQEAAESAGDWAPVETGTKISELPRYIERAKGICAEYGEPGKKAAEYLCFHRAMQLILPDSLPKDIRLRLPSARVRLWYSNLANRDEREFMIHTVQIQLRLLLQEKGRDPGTAAMEDLKTLERVARQEGIWEWTEADIGPGRFVALFEEYAAAVRAGDGQKIAEISGTIKMRLRDVLWARREETGDIDSANIDTLETIVRREGLYE